MACLNHSSPGLSNWHVTQSEANVAEYFAGKLDQVRTAFGARTCVTFDASVCAHYEHCSLPALFVPALIQSLEMVAFGDSLLFVVLYA